MVSQNTDVRVVLTADGARFQAFRWQGRVLRVLAVEDMRATGLERRYKVATPEGGYELALDLVTGRWSVRCGPSWLARARARLENLPRYTLPASRRRVRSVRVAVAAPPAPGGSYAGRLALVRQ